MPPRVSVLIPARNEQENIERCVLSLISQGPDIEILVADDSSEDATAAIVRRICEQAPNVRLISVPPLPEGWLGKNHALHVAAQQAQGEWLLFRDADTVHADGGLMPIVDRAEREGLDLLSLSPEQETRTWWECAVMPLVFQELGRLYPYQRVNDPADPLAAANGQYLLFRRTAYWRLGGHEAVRAEMLEDVALAQRAKKAGLRIWFGSGQGTVRTRMYSRFGEMWRGWTKNLFLLYGRNSRAIRRVEARLLVRDCLPPLVGLALLLNGWPNAAFGWLLLLFYARQQFLYARWLRASGSSELGAPWLWPGAFLFLGLLVNSERRYSRKLEVEWKGRRYSTK